MKFASGVASVVTAMILAQVACARVTTANYSQSELLKNWALSRCLAKVYADPKVKDDANAAASAYLEFGSQPMDAYEAIDALVEQFAARKLTGSISSQFNTMKCIDLLNSKELDLLVGKWAGKR